MSSGPAGEPARLTAGLRDPFPLSLGVFAAFLGVVVWETWPLASGLGSLLPPHHDPYLNTWIVGLHLQHLIEAPLRLFHGNAFYPIGNSLTFSELLLVPALVGLPVFLVSGNPILAYNLALLLVWAFSSWAMYYAASRLTGSRAAGLVAGVIYATFPYRQEYYVDIQMQTAFGFPLGLLAFSRFLETQSWRYLAWTVLVVLLQALSSWYYGILLALLLAAFALPYGLLRWRGWTLSLVGKLGVAALLLAALLGPFAWPYFQTRAEFRIERTLGDLLRSESHADILTYLESGARRWYVLSPTGRVAEVDLFPGGVSLGLALLGWGWLRDQRRQEGRTRLVSPFLVAGLAVSLAFLWVAGQGRRVSLGALSVSLPRAHRLLAVLVVLVLLRLAVAGWQHFRAGVGGRTLTEGEWGLVLGWLMLFFFVCSLGPMIHYRRTPVGPGLYQYLYAWLVPLHAIRLLVRYGFVVLFTLALLAAFGVAAVARWTSGRPWLLRAVTAGVLGLVVLESLPSSAFPYRPVPWAAPPPVYDFLRGVPGDFAILEWPLAWGEEEALAMLWSLHHRKRVVNGFSGVRPSFQADLSEAVSDQHQDPFPSPEVYRRLREIYPLRYIVVHPAALADFDRARWEDLRRRADPRVRFVGRFGADDLYELAAVPEQGVRLERWVSYEFLQSHLVVRAALRPRVQGTDLDQWGDVLFNERSVGRISLNREATLTTALVPPFRRAVPNVIAFQYGYRRPPSALDARYRIGTTGTMSPGDLRVVSVGQPHGSASSIQLNGVELSPDHRGYNLVALDAAGQTVTVDVFDTFLRVGEAHRLAAWVRALEPGTIVVGGVRDEGSGQLTADAVEALRALGVAGDLRGHFREAHAFVGVKGAPPGSVPEALGPRPIELAVGRIEMVAGRSDARVGFELTRFALEPAAATR
ncbi:MAG: hypothetical protein HY002_13930 [Candidatus Rokubacteria bacterium]|nr:hypothetical protein [Candidatus Rokubacteria bacterium]